MRRAHLIRAGLALVATVWLVATPLLPHEASAACMDSVVARAVKRYAITGSSPQTYTETCTLAVVSGRRYLMELLQPTGGPSGTFARVVYKGVELLGTDDLGTAGVLVSRAFTPDTTGTLLVTLSGSSGFGVDLRITHVPEPMYGVFNKTFVRGSGAPKWQSQAFGFMNGTPPGPHRLTIVNGNPDSTKRTQDTEIELNGNLIVSTGEITQGRAILTYDVTLESENTVKAKIYSPSGRKVSLYFTATDASGPSIVFAAPPETTVTRDASIAIGGTVDEPETGERITMDGTPLPMSAGSFSTTAALSTNGWRRFVFAATNGGCQSDTAVRVAIRDILPPSFSLWPGHGLTVSAGTSSITLFGKWRDSTFTRIQVDGDTVASGWALHDSLPFSRIVPLDYGPNRILVRAVDATGNVSEAMRVVFRATGSSAALDSVLSPSAVDPTQVLSFREGIEFLFQGAGAVQTIADPTDIIEGREAVLRGIVVGRDHGRLPNVLVSVKDHPELGTTVSRADGRFDLVVNGGESYTLRFTLDEFLESQRSAVTMPLEYTVLDTVAMIGRSQRWYYADTTQARTIVGRFESDLNGDRRMLMFVPNGALASVTPVGGSSVSLDKYRIRLKEFTVGADGANAMPGALPPTTAYTYCIDMSLVEADSILDNHHSGSTAPEIRFSKPIVTYVRDFLGMPVGTPVPSGFYDPRLGAWVAEDDGIVLKMLGVLGGYARLDTDGDAQPDSASQLVSAGIDSLELARLPSQFVAGDQLWRVPVTHFSSHDYNYNLASNPEAGGSSAPAAGPAEPFVEEAEKTCNCIIENENRVLGESIPVSGTGYSLNYRSNRVPGNRVSYWLRVPLTGTTAPPSGLRVHLAVEVAGRRFANVYTGLGANESRLFRDWDGTDAYGRRVVGAATAVVRIGYEYPAGFAAKKAGSGRTFRNPASTATRVGLAALGDRDERRIEWRTQRASIGAPSMASAGLGGWTISPHHFYDPSGRGALYRGDGDTRYGAARRPVITRFAGTGFEPGSLPNGGQRLGTAIYPEGDMAFGPDGSLYFIGRKSAGGTAGRYIGRIKPDGTVVTVAGSGHSPSAGAPDSVVSGTSALTQKLCLPSDVAVGADGSVYVVDDCWRQVYRISTDGIIHVLAGSYARGYGSFVEGQPAVSSALSVPTALAVHADGTVVFADGGTGWRRIVQITPDGLIRGLAGNGGTTPTGDEGKADSLAVYFAGGDGVSDLVIDPNRDVLYLSAHRLYRIRRDGQKEHLPAPDHGPSRLAVDPEGGILIVQAEYNGVYRLEPGDSIITRLTGGFATYPPSLPRDFDQTEGDYAIGTVPHTIGGIAVAPDGAVYISETRAAGIGGRVNGIRRIAPAAPGVVNGEIIYPDEDGRSVYHFTPTGRHLRTKDAWTGVTLYSFDYDGFGQLTEIIDANGRTTEILRHGGGAPRAIVGPFGQRDTLAVDGNGYLALVRNERSGEEHVPVHDPDGLLIQFTDARGEVQEFTYRTGSGESEDGRLQLDRDAIQAGISLAVQHNGSERTITRTTDQGRVTTYRITERMSGLRSRLTTYPDHSYQYTSDSTNTTSTPYGEVARVVGTAGEETFVFSRPDPRYGLLSEVPSVTTTKLPSGRIRTLAQARTYSGSGQFTETFSLNGGSPFTTSYDSTSSARRLLSQTPLNRRTTTWLDAAGRPTAIKMGGLAVVDIDYDASGRVERVSQGARSLEYDYDAAGRLLQVQNALGHTASMHYDLADRDTGHVLPGGRAMGMRYDGAENFTSLRPPGRPLHEFTFDDVGLNDAYSPPVVAGVSSTATSFAYNSDRQLTGVARPDGISLSLAYSSSKGRLESFTQPRGTTSFEYWDTPQSGGAGPSGQLKTLASSDSVTCTFVYDGPLLASQTWSGPVSGTVSRMFDNAFRDSLETVSVGAATSTVRFGYDADGLLTQAAAVPAGWVLDVHRADSTGLVDSTAVGSGAGQVTSSVSYNAHGELAELHYSLAGAPLFHQSIQRDVLGRVTRVEERWYGGAARVLSYGHDLAGRLDSVAVAGAVHRRYEYDGGGAGNGNRTAERDGSGAMLASATYDAQDRLLTYGSAAYSYTANGELARRVVGTDTTRYTYDVLGSLTRVRLANGDSLTFILDGQGRRVGRKSNGVMQRGWLYSNAATPVAEMNGAGALVNRYVHGTLWHAPDLVVRGDTAHRVVTDHLGSVRAVVRTSDGLVLQRREYDVWGVVTADTAGAFQSLGFAGGLTDSATGLVRFGARDYDPAIGRWTAKDPIGFAGGDANLYNYASGEPASSIDPTGTKSWPFGSGTIWIDPECSDRAIAWLFVIPEEGSVRQVPGNQVPRGKNFGIDAMRIPDVLVKKIPDNGAIRVECNCNGELESVGYWQWPWFFGQADVWKVGGRRPKSHSTNWPAP